MARELVLAVCCSTATALHFAPSPATTTTRWQCVSIDAKSSSDSEELITAATATNTVGDQIRKGESVVQLFGAASPEECALLTATGSLLAEKERKRRHAANLPAEGMARLLSLGAASRRGASHEHALVLPTSADQACESILRRTLQSIDDSMPSILPTLFGSKGRSDDDGLLKLYDTNALVFACREPAVNIYTGSPSTPAEFLAHEDGQSLTVLLPLTEPDAVEGGGTGFWSQDSRGHRVEGPSLVLQPPAGTALLFGGRVTHCGMPVLSGTRAVLVASFSRGAGAR